MVVFRKVLGFFGLATGGFFCITMFGFYQSGTTVENNTAIGIFLLASLWSGFSFANKAAMIMDLREVKIAIAAFLLWLLLLVVAVGTETNSSAFDYTTDELLSGLLLICSWPLIDLVDVVIELFRK